MLQNHCQTHLPKSEHRIYTTLLATVKRSPQRPLGGGIAVTLDAPTTKIEDESDPPKMQPSIPLLAHICRHGTVIRLQVEGSINEPHNAGLDAEFLD